MSLHKSLVLKSRLARPRSVLSRSERLEMLKESGKWKDGDSVFGLPKVRTILAKVKKKKKEVKAAEGAVLAAGAVPGAAPAPGAPAAAAAASAPGKKTEEKKK